MKLTFFFSIFESTKRLPRITTRKKKKKAKEFKQQHTHFAFKRRDGKPLTLSLLSRPPHAEVFLLWNATQKRNMLKTNCLLLTKPKQSVFSYKHPYQSKVTDRITTKPSTNSLTEGIKTSADIHRSSRTFNSRLTNETTKLCSPDSLKWQMYLRK